MTMFKTGEAKIESAHELCSKCGKNFVVAGQGGVCEECLAKGKESKEEAKGSGKAPEK